LFCTHTIPRQKGVTSDSVGIRDAGSVQARNVICSTSSPLYNRDLLLSPHRAPNDRVDSGKPRPPSSCFASEHRSSGGSARSSLPYGSGWRPLFPGIPKSFRKFGTTLWYTLFGSSRFYDFAEGRDEKTLAVIGEAPRSFTVPRRATGPVTRRPDGRGWVSRRQRQRICPPLVTHNRLPGMAGML